MPALSRRHYRRELLVWSLLPIAMGAVEGGVTGVIAKNAFAGQVQEARLNLAVAVLAGAPAFANIMSFVWPAVSHGRHKIALLSTLQIISVSFLMCIALAPLSEIGLWMLMLGAIGARVTWSGVIMLRTTVWQANYPRTARATLAGKLATVQAIVMAATAGTIGLAMDISAEAFRLVYPIAMLCGITGALAYRRMRMRGHAAMLAAERREPSAGRVHVNPWMLRRTLHEDPMYRRYMTAMFVFGSGNLMVTAPLIIMLKDRFVMLSEAWQMFIAATIPLLIMPLSIPVWSKLLDRVHIVPFRAVHSWAFVSSIVLVLIGCLLTQPWIIVLAAIMKGVAFGGGVLGWNLGHHDFASVEKASQYMGVHVTLTGLRGVTSPIIGVSVYQLLEWWRPGSGPLVFTLCLALSIAGALGFLVLARTMPRDEHIIAPPPAR